MSAEPLDASNLDEDPIRQFGSWFDHARGVGQPEPEAMALATASAEGVPSVRFVLLKGFDESGFVFYTNGNSRKGREIAANPVAALAFRWWAVQRQVRVSGPIGPVEASESDAYFRTRPRGAQLGAWASAQSEQISDRAALENEYARVDERFAGHDVPRPPWWGGFRVRPIEVEFWQNRPDRLHDRFAYTLHDGRWRIHRLNP